MTPAQLKDVADYLDADPRGPLNVEGNGLGNLVVLTGSGEYIAWVDHHDGQINWVV